MVRGQAVVIGKMMEQLILSFIGLLIKGVYRIIGTGFMKMLTGIT